MKILSVIILSLSLAISAKGESLTDWLPTMKKIIQEYEGSSYGAITPDFDNQGLSLGILQWTLAQGDLNEVIEEVGFGRATEIAKETMPEHSTAWIEILRTLNEGRRKPSSNERKQSFNEARRLSLDFQNRNGGNNVAVEGDFADELKSWLMHSEISSAQDAAILKEMERAAIAAAAWKKSQGDNSPLTFPVFVFFFNTSVHAGLSSFGITLDGDGNITENSLSNATRLARIDRGLHYVGDPKDSREEKRKMRRKHLVGYLADWLSVEWPLAKNPLYYTDSKKNAALLRNADLSDSQIHLLYMGYVRATVGNTPYSMVTMNRVVISVLGEGWVNQSKKDIRKFYSERQDLTQ